MKALFTLLLLVNLALAAYTLLAPRQAALDAAALPGQINADQIQVIPPRPAAPVQPAACIQWGSFAEAELEGVRRALVGAALGERAIETSVPVVAGWWVYIPPRPDRQAIDAAVRSLQAAGVDEYYVVDAEGPTRNAISLGIFKSEESALAFLLAVQAKGVRTARVGPREHRVTQTAMVLRDPDAQVSARLAQLALGFPGSELRAIDCPG
jgi:hypothetical protein